MRTTWVHLAIALFLAATVLPAAGAVGFDPADLLGGPPPHACDVRGAEPTGELGCDDWSTLYETPETDTGLSIATGPDGHRIYVAGTTGGDEEWSQEGEALVLALDAQTGERLWVRTYQHENLPYANFQDVTVDPSGERVYVAGWADDPPRINQPENGTGITVALDAGTGETLWTASEPGVDALGVHLAYVPSEETVATLYWAKQLPSGWGMLFTSYDATTGTEEWNTTHVDPSTRTTPCCLTAGPAGDTAYAAAGQLNETMVTVAFDLETGQKRWVEYTAGGNPWPSAADATADTLVVGGIPGLSGQRVWGLDADTGETQWVADNGNGGIVDVAAAPGHGLALASGETPIRPATSVGSLFAVHLSNGTVAWEHRYDPGFGTGDYEDVDLAPGGDVAYAAGHAPTSPYRQDYILTAVDVETGRDLWTARWNRGPASSDLPFWNDVLAVGPDGDRLTMTGRTLGRDGVDDIGVVSYEVPPPDAGETADHLLPAEATVEEDAEDPLVAASVFGNASGGYAASVFGNATGGDAASVFGNATGAFTAASVFGDATGGLLAASGTGNASCHGGVRPFGGLCPAASGTGEARGSPGLAATDPPRPTEFANASVREDARGRWAAASVLGDASCEAELFGVPCVAASGTGNASAATFVGPSGAASGTGDASADGLYAAAASGSGDAAGDSVAASGTGDAAAYVLAASGTGNATGFVAASGTGDPNGSAAATATGDAEGGYVVSGTGDATACEHALLCLAVSGTGDADGEILATSGAGDAQGCTAVSGTGEAQSEDCPLFLVPVTVSEEASGCETAREDADSEAACQDADPDLLP